MTQGNYWIVVHGKESLGLDAKDRAYGPFDSYVFMCRFARARFSDDEWKPEQLPDKDAKQRYHVIRPGAMG